jgi:NADH-quinone oxidoreductase subunit C
MSGRGRTAVADEVREGIPEDGAGDEEPSAPVPPPDEVAAAVWERFPATVFVDSRGQAVLYVPREQLADIVRFLFAEQQFAQVVDVTAVDHLRNVTRDVPGVALERFEVVANLLSHLRNRRLRLIAEVPESDPVVPSLTPLFSGVELAEREVYDLYGIRFDGHPDLTRILMPDDWEGHPLRKDDATARVPVQFKAAGVARPKVD